MATTQQSQVTVTGRPQPKSWDDFERGCLDSYGGGYRAESEREIFRHGMSTVFNLLRGEFPPAEQCKAAPDLLADLRQIVEDLADAGLDRNAEGEVYGSIAEAWDTIRRATGQ